MRRVALFAHYDRDGLVDDYVLYYLRGLKGLCQRIVFVSDCALKEGEKEKLAGLAELAFAERHGEYDFGSWKRGFAYLQDELEHYDEAVIANDSCYAPAFPFEGTFERMRAVACDFWAPTATKLKDGSFDHVNSYFLVFRKPVLLDPDFLSFWQTVVAQPSADLVVEHYEKGLSQLLVKKGFAWASLVPIDAVASFYKTAFVKKTFFDYELCWLKVRLFRDNPDHVTELSEALTRFAMHYPRDLIDAHMRRLIGTDDPKHYHYRIGAFDWAPGGGRVVRVTLKLKKNRWWKFYAYICGVPVFALVLPRRTFNRKAAS